jgi:hypothetical protein
MRRTLCTALALACLCSLGLTNVWAGGPECTGKKITKADGCTKTCSGDATDFPKMTMVVNGKQYDCCMSAAKAAKDAKTGIVFMVGERKFDDKAEAMEALAEMSESHLKRFLTVACVADGKVMYCSDTGACSGKANTLTASDKGEGATCSKSSTTVAKKETSGCCKSGAKAMAKSEGCDKSGSKTALAKADGCCKSKGATMTKEEIEACCKNAKEVKFMVMGRSFAKREDAVRAHDDAMTAIKTVKMTYLVDGKEVDCASKVCPTAKKDGKVVYVVNKDKLSCEMEARIALAKAQYEAARSFAEKLAKI